MSTLVFTASNDLLSRSIRWFTKGRASHVAIGAQLFDVPVLIHATIGGVQVSPRVKWMRGRILVAEYAFTHSSGVDVAGAVKKLGERYDYVGLLGFIPVLIARWFGVRVRNPFASASAVVCSELVLRADVNNNVKEWRGMDPERASPVDLLEACVKSESFVLLPRS